MLAGWWFPNESPLGKQKSGLNTESSAMSATCNPSFSYPCLAQKT